MKLTITPTSINPYSADVNGHAVSFNLRSGSTTSLIGYLPKALRDNGSASNVTIPLATFVLGTAIERESNAGASGPRGPRSTSTPTVILELNADGKVDVLAVHGDARKVLHTVDDADVARALRIAKAFADYKADLAHYVVDKLPKYARAVCALRDAGVPDSVIEATLPRPKEPTKTHIRYAFLSPKSK